MKYIKTFEGYKNSLYSTTSLINEDFKSMKNQYLQQGIESSIIDNYINTFKSIKDLRELNDDIQGFPENPTHQQHSLDHPNLSLTLKIQTTIPMKIIHLERTSLVNLV